MLHYSCDLCRRPLDPEQDLRYVVKLEVYAAFDPLQVDETDTDRDNLQELAEILEGIEDASDPELSSEVCQTLRFDLCPECRKKFLKNPLGRSTSAALNFSAN